MKLIDKAALVAEIDKLKGKVNDISSFSNGWQQALRLAEIEIDTLEVKEVDLEKEIDFAMPSKYCWSGDGEAVYSKKQMRNFAKHFFELGLKAQKGEEI